jgi:hypothetical protein
MRKWLVLTTVGSLLQLFVQAQQTILGLETYFDEAYWRYPNIPRGLLEAAAYSASHFTNLQPRQGITVSSSNSDNGSNMPQRYGLFALIENGRGYFKNNLWTVCNSSGITPDQYNKDVRLQILAVAKYLSREASFKQPDVLFSAEDFAVLLNKLAAFPDDSSVVNKYALALFKYDIYDQLQRGINTPSLKRAPVKVQMEQIFPAPLLRKLRSPAVEVDVMKDEVKEADHPTGGYVKASAGTISWLKNPRAPVSNHIFRVLQQTAYSGQEIQFASIPNGIYRITNVNSKKVLNTNDCSGRQPARVTQTTWDGKACQRWRFDYAGDGWYRITSFTSGKALEIPGGSKNNVQLYLKDIKDHDSQLWRLLSAGSNGELKLVNKASGKVPEVFAGSANNGAAVLQTAYTGKTHQQWTLTAVHLNDEQDEVHRFKQVDLGTTEAISTKH